MQHSRYRVRSGLLTALAVVFLVSCQRNLPSAKTEARSRAADLALSPVESAPAPSVVSRATPQRQLQPGSVSDTTAVPSLIIRTGDASVLVDSLEPAVARVTALAARLGGWVANTAMQAGPDQIRTATVTIKVPAGRYDEALGGLEPIGDIETVTTQAEDVGEEFVDLRARSANARRLEERLVALLATRTGKLDDVLAVERELARVREDIERIEGRLRYLRNRAAVSTLTVTVHERGPLLGGTPGVNVIGDAFVAAWRNLVGFTAGVIAALGWLLPLALLVALVAAIGRRTGLAARFTERRATAPSDG